MAVIGGVRNLPKNARPRLAPLRADTFSRVPAVKRYLADQVLRRPVVWQYGMAVALTGYAILISFLFQPVSARAPFLLFLAAVMLSTWYGGLAAGLMATLLSYVAIAFLFQSPVGTLAVSDPGTLVDIAMFVWVAVLMAWLYGRLRQAWEQSNAARLEAEQAMCLRDSVLAVISHDLKNPLATIDMAAQFGERVLNRPEGTEGTASSAERNAEHMRAALAEIRKSARGTRTMVEELLDVAYLQAGKPLVLNREPVDLVALTREVTGEVARVEGEHRFEISCTVQDLIGDWDAVRLKRVLQNLLTNAAKYSPPGSVVKVSVASVMEGQPPGMVSETQRTRAAHGEAVLTVRDQGCGIPVDEVSRVFEQFYRASNVVASAPGTGIGLASVQQIVQQHGGTVNVVSGEGKGTTFTVRLPLRAGSGQAPAAHRGGSYTSAPCAASHHMALKQ